MAFKKINTSEQYLNDRFFKYAIERGGKYFLQTDKGEVEINKAFYDTLENAPKVDSKRLANLDLIGKVFKKADGQGGGPAVGTALETEKTYTSGDSNPIYFNTSYDTDTLKAWCQAKKTAGLFEEGKLSFGFDNLENDYITIMDLQEQEMGTGFAMMVTSGDIVWVSDDNEDLEAQKGWQVNTEVLGQINLNENGKWVGELEGQPIEISISSFNSDIPQSEWNGVWVSETEFAGSSVSYKHYAELNNKEIVDIDKDTYDAIVAHTDEYSEYEFYALNDVYYNKDYINRVQNGVAELVNGDKIALKDAEKSAISGEGSAFRAIGEGETPTDFFNINKMVKVLDSNGKKYLELKKGIRIEIPSSIYESLKTGAIEVNEVAYIANNPIVSGFKSGNDYYVVFNTGIQLKISATDSASAKEIFEAIFVKANGYYTVNGTFYLDKEIFKVFSPKANVYIAEFKNGMQSGVSHGEYNTFTDKADLSVSVSGSNIVFTIKRNGVEIEPGEDGKYAIDNQDTVEISAVAEDGYELTSLKVDGVEKISEEQPITLVATNDIAIVAEAEQEQPSGNLTPLVSGATYSTIKLNVELSTAEVKSYLESIDWSQAESAGEGGKFFFLCGNISSIGEMSEDTYALVAQTTNDGALYNIISAPSTPVFSYAEDMPEQSGWSPDVVSADGVISVTEFSATTLDSTLNGVLFGQNV